MSRGIKLTDINFRSQGVKKMSIEIELKIVVQFRHTAQKNRLNDKVSGHQHWWLAGGYDLEMNIFRSG